MSKRRPLAIPSALLCALSFFPVSAWAIDAQAVKDAREWRETLRNYVEVETVPRTELIRADLFVLEMEHEAGLIGRAEYCAKAPGLAEDLDRSTREELRVGAFVDCADILHQVEKRAAIRKRCAPE